VEGQKKILEEIRAFLKQSIQIPSDFNGFGTQIQLFGAALTIFFGRQRLHLEPQPFAAHNWSKQEELQGPDCIG
jgi:hypothetical protein